LNEVILVGNGTSILDAEKGPEIDDHRHVVRFNDCKLKGFERHTGTKTSLWFTVMKLQPRKLEELSPAEIIVHSWHNKAETCEVFKTYAGLPNASKLDHMIIPQICAFMDDNSYRSWSTGALAIWLMLARFSAVTLTVFDWWEREQHHYGDKERRGTLHKPQMEKAFIDRLTEQGKAQFL